MQVFARLVLLPARLLSPFLINLRENRGRKIRKIEGHHTHFEENRAQKIEGHHTHFESYRLFSGFFAMKNNLSKGTDILTPKNR
jgi:hypothetical protein